MWTSSTSLESRRCSTGTGNGSCAASTPRRKRPTRCAARTGRSGWRGASRQAGADAIEIHTGTFCEAFRAGKHAAELAKIRAAAAFGASIGLKVFAGHGLDVRNIVPILEIPEIEEFNIGHSIIARAVFLGLPAAVKEIADLIHGA